MFWQREILVVKNKLDPYILVCSFDWWHGVLIQSVNVEFQCPQNSRNSRLIDVKHSKWKVCNDIKVSYHNILVHRAKHSKRLGFNDILVSYRITIFISVLRISYNDAVLQYINDTLNSIIKFMIIKSWRKKIVSILFIMKNWHIISVSSFVKKKCC